MHAAGKGSGSAKATRLSRVSPEWRSEYAPPIVCRFCWPIPKRDWSPVFMPAGAGRRQTSWGRRLTLCGHGAVDRKTCTWRLARRLGLVATRWARRLRDISHSGARQLLETAVQGSIYRRLTRCRPERPVFGKSGSPENAHFAEPTVFIHFAGIKIRRAECCLSLTD